MACWSASAVLALAVRGSCLRFAQGFLDGVEVWRVGWEIEQCCSTGCDSLAYAGDLVRAEVVHDHHIARSQCWTENVVEVSEEYLGVGCRLDGHRGDHAAQAHRTQDGKDLPAALGRGLMHPHSARRSGVAPGHLSRDAAFIQEDHPLRRD